MRKSEFTPNLRQKFKRIIGEQKSAPASKAGADFYVIRQHGDCKK
jgi:serine phosphatase RsbU (regulator of sigma subunit)